VEGGGNREQRREINVREFLYEKIEGCIGSVRGGCARRTEGLTVRSYNSSIS
jgi:hypothetical protein